MIHRSVLQLCGYSYFGIMNYELYKELCMYIVVEFVGLLTRGLVGMVDNLNNY